MHKTLKIQCVKVLLLKYNQLNSHSVQYHFPVLALQNTNNGPHGLLVPLLVELVSVLVIGNILALVE
jgi:hypothetical protein